MSSYGSIELKDLFNTIQGEVYRTSDQRDRIFTIIKLSTEAKEYPDAAFCHVDYTKSTAEVYTTFAQSFMQTTLNPSILIEACGCTRASLYDLPNWVPDWRQQNSSDPGLLKRELYSTHKSTEIQFKVAPKPNFLALVGIEIAVVNAKLAFQSTKALVSKNYDRTMPIYLFWLYNEYRKWLSEEYGQRSEALEPKTQTSSTSLSNKPYSLKLVEFISILVFDTWNRNGNLWEERERIQHQSTSSTFKTLKSLQLIAESLDPFPDDILSQSDMKGIYEAFYPQIHSFGSYSLVFTSNGSYGMVPNACEIGDIIFTFFGGNMPFVLRPMQGQDTYKLVGPAYVHGYMDGKVMDEFERGERVEETFFLV